MHIARSVLKIRKGAYFDSANRGAAPEKLHGMRPRGECSPVLNPAVLFQSEGIRHSVDAMEGYRRSYKPEARQL